MQREAERARRRQAWRRGEASPEVALAVAADDRIDGKRERVEPRRLRALDHRAVEALVLVIIELEQLGR